MKEKYCCLSTNEALSIRALESQVRILGGRRPVCSKVDHLRRAVYARHSALGDEGSQLGGNLAVAAADVQDMLVSRESQMDDNGIIDALLGGGIALVIVGIPLIHAFASGRAGTYSCRVRRGE